MAEFLDDQAEESENDDEGGEQLGAPPKKKAKRNRIDSDDEDDEEDDENEIDEAMKGFVVTDDEVEEGDKNASSSDEEDADPEEGLSDEDRDLLEENLGIQREKKAHRARIADEDDEDDKHRIARNIFANEGDEDAPGVGRSSAAVAASSKGHSLDEAPDDDDERSSLSGEVSDSGSFIVDDDDLEAGGTSQRKKQPRHKIRRSEGEEAALNEAKDVFGVDFDYDELYGEEEGSAGDASEIDEEAEEGDLRQRRAGKRKPKQNLLQTIEPAEIERGYLSEADQRIQMTDLPERFQLRRWPVTPKPDDESGSNIALYEEALWIWNNYFSAMPLSLQAQPKSDTLTEASTVPKILAALKLIRNESFEPPFISFYRKEKVDPLMISDVWKVYLADEKYCQFEHRRYQLMELMRRMQQYQLDCADGALANCESRLLETDADIAPVAKMTTLEQLNDARSHFQLYYGSELSKMYAFEKKKHEEQAAALLAGADSSDKVAEQLASTNLDASFKQASRTDAYSLCASSQLGGFVAKFGLTPQQFADNLEAGFAKHEVDQYPFKPITTAEDYINRNFSTAEAVLDGVKYMVAKQLSCEPRVRGYVRQWYRSHALIHVKPTKKGRTEIDENHPIFTERYLINKPIRDLEKEEFLRLVQAEQSQLITITMTADPLAPGVPNAELMQRPSALYQIIVDKQLYYRDEYSDDVQQWNRLRQEAIQMCLEKFLFPFMAKETKARLLKEAKDCIISECSYKLYKFLKTGPYVSDIRDEDNNSRSKAVKIAGICYPNERELASFCVVIDGDGEVMDSLRLPHLTKRLNAYRREESELKKQDLNSLRQFLIRRTPHAIAIAGESLEALSLKTDIERLAQEMYDANDVSYIIPVEIVDCELAKVYQHSKKAQADYPDYPPLLRQAISLARRLQDPLPEFCQMCTPDEEILCLSYHPLQDQVNKDELLQALLLELINRVNEVGVDVNRSIEHSHLFPMLQFVCGLGPRKAAYLVKLIRQTEGVLEYRTKLVTTYHMGKQVFLNCAGFLKIDVANVAEKTDEYVEPLDGTRIHPETYEWARKMAIDALEYDDTNEEEVNPTAALEEIMESPDKLKDLDLDAFAQELERQNLGNKALTLYDIRTELTDPYKDFRNPYKRPENIVLFNMLTKETPTTFNIGKLVMGRVMHVVHRKPKAEDMDSINPIRNDTNGMWQCPFCLREFHELNEVWLHTDNNGCPGQAVGVKIRLENGITGFIPTKYISDRPVDNPAERVRPNQPIYCRVLKVDVDKFQAELSCRTSDLMDREGQFRPGKDTHYDFDAEERDRKEESEGREAAQRCQYVMRVIAHPSFANISYKDAERKLSNMDPGDVIFRPSSKGTDHLTATWKVAPGVYGHIDVKEESKDNQYSLGKSLLIGEEEFEDLDEIIARYIQPMASHARDIMNYKYYYDPGKADLKLRTKEHIVSHMITEKRTNPKRIPYVIWPSKEFPGKFILSYLPREKARHEFITVTPDGFRFRQQMFQNLNQLFKWFKEHFGDPAPGAPGTPSHSAATPYVDSNAQFDRQPFDPTNRMAAAAAPTTAHIWPHMHLPMPPYGAMGPLMPPPPAPPSEIDWNRIKRQVNANNGSAQSDDGSTGPTAIGLYANNSDEHRFDRKRSTAAGVGVDWSRTAHTWGTQRNSGTGDVGGGGRNAQRYRGTSNNTNNNSDYRRRTRNN